MPAQKSTASAKVAKTRKSVSLKVINKSADDTDAEAQSGELVKAQTPADIFQTFCIEGSPGAVMGGLSIVRPLADGVFEIVNIKNISQHVLGSEEMARYIKSDPGRLAEMMISKKEWDSAILKCDVAVRITQKKLFRFFKLPNELREKIIKLVVNPANGIRYMRELRGGSPAITLMLTCKQMYAESRKPFWNNSFYVDHMDISALRRKGPNDYFFKNVQKLTYAWKDNVRDPFAFRIIRQLPNLKVLDLDIRYYIFDLRSKYPPWNHNDACQDEIRFGKFRELYGLDALLKIRGLEKVIITVKDTIPLPERKQFLNSRDAFLAHLMNTLTVEKPLPESISDTKKVGKGKGKGKAIEIDEASDAERFDSETEESEYVPRSTRTRTAKAVKKFGFESSNGGFLAGDDIDDE